jgi:hypothetical protein
MSDLKLRVRSEWERVTGEFPVLEAAQIIRSAESIVQTAATEPRLRRRWLVAVAASLAAFVAIGGPLLMLRGEGTQSMPAGSPVTSSAVPSAPPPGESATTSSAAAAGSHVVIPTGLGDFAWTRITPVSVGDFPDLHDVVVVDGGFLVEQDGRLLWSPDGLSWSEQDLPAELLRADGLSTEADSLLLAGVDHAGGVGLWQYAGSAAWIRVAAVDAPPRPELPAVAGAEWEWSGWSAPTMAGDSVVMLGSARVRLDLVETGYASWDPDASVLRTVAIPSESIIATHTIAVEEVDGVITIRATDSGSGETEEITISMPDVDPMVVVERLLTANLTIDFVAAAGDGGEAEVMVAPWSRPEANTDVVIRADDEDAVADVHHFTAYPSTFVDSVGGRERWVSPDGISWVRQDPLFGPGDDVEVVEADGRFVARRFGSAGAWLSADGVEWNETRVPGNRPDMSSVVPAGFGWVAWGMEHAGEGFEALAVWITADGEEWERIDLDLIGIGMTPIAGQFGVVAAGDVVFVDRRLDTSGVRTVWVGRLEWDS